MTVRLRLLAGGFVAALAAVGVYASGAHDFIPDSTFKGSTLTGWHSIGKAAWKAENGEIVVNPSAGGGWLTLNKNLQDLQFYAEVRCGEGCKSGLLMRAEKTSDGGMKGIFVSLAGGDFASYVLTVDAQGNEVSREKLAAPAGRGGAGGGGGRANAGGGGRAAGGRAPAAAANNTGARRPEPSMNGSEWNDLMVNLSGSALRSTINGAVIPAGSLEGAPSYGALAIYAGGSAEIRFKNVSWKDVNTVTEEKDHTSPHFTTQRVMDRYYGWSAAAADINHDGVLDIVSGPFYYLGPDYRERRIYREGRQYNPATEYSPDMVNYSADFTGDGWPDILSTEMRAMALYVNPKGESRRWDRHMVLPDITTEIVVMRDIDGDGKPEIIYGTNSGYCWSKPDPANPTAVWPCHHISTGRTNIHGLGVGDVNGDGRLDLVTPAGWYEQPASGTSTENWPYHEEDFGINGETGVLPGGGEIGVYDVNGDGLPDVVTSLAAHDWGLAWFEQKKGGDKAWIRHEFLRDYSTQDKNAGGVTFSEPHATAFADMDGDGIPDFIVGKSMWHHLENYNGPDPYGPAVVVVYRTVRNPKAPGGAEFVPEVVNNHSGVGSKIEAVDLNKDGAKEIITASGNGVFIFWSKPGKWPKAAVK